MNLSKAFYTINHRVLLTKLDTYGFSRTSLKQMQNYLCNSQQKISISGSFSNWTQVITGTHQGSILCPLLFNIFLMIPSCLFQNAISVVMPMTTLCILLEKT